MVKIIHHTALQICEKQKQVIESLVPVVFMVFHSRIHQIILSNGILPVMFSHQKFN